MSTNEKSEKIEYYRLDHESRITRLETTIENMNQTLIRIENKIDKLDSRIWSNFYWTIASFAAILLLIAHGFKWII
jgi:hypothetical protein